jgi:hypothetical protein
MTDTKMHSIFWFMSANDGGRVVFESPRSLNLRLVCTENRPVAEDAGCLASAAYCHVISCSYVIRHLVGNVVEALKQNNRVCKIHFRNIRSLLSKALSEIREPFPALTVHRRPCFQIRSWVDLPRAHVSDISLQFIGIAFPTLQTLLSSTLDLVRLDVATFRILGTFQPTRWLLPYPCCQGSTLKELHILFHWQSPQSWAD